MTITAPATSCPLCGSLRLRRPLGGALRRCQDCDIAWTTATAAATDEMLYDDAYFAGGGYEDYFQPAARRFEAAVRVKWLGRHSSPATLLEIGSAAGFFLEAIGRAGVRAQGIEISPGPARYAGTQLGVSVLQGDFRTAGPIEKVDVVCAFHVLEHVEDPKALLAFAHAALRPGGLLALEVPNISAASARRLGRSWPHLQLEYHRWHFSPRSLEKLLRDGGFEVEHLDTLMLRAYMPAAFRRRQARALVASDLRDLHSLRLVHRERGDLIRVIARRPANAVVPR